MHDGILRISGLTKAEKLLVERLESEVYSEDERAEALTLVIADECRLPAELLPPNCPDDLFPQHALRERILSIELRPFGQDIWRHLQMMSWDSNTYSHAFSEATMFGLSGFIASKRNRLEAQCKPGRESSLSTVMPRYDAAADRVLSNPSKLIEPMSRDGRLRIKPAPKHLDLDGHIPGAELHAG